MSWKIKVIPEVFSHNNVQTAGSMVSTFRQWLDNDKSHISFGRFGPLDRPSTASDVTLSRVHVLNQTDIAKYNARGTSIFNRTSDRYLVYAVNPEDPTHYLLIALIDPNAHETMKNTNFVLTLIEIAKNEFGIKW